MQIVGFNRVRPLHNWIAWISPNQYRSTLANNDTNVIQMQYKHHNESNENWYWHGKVWRRAKIEDDSGFSWQQRAASGWNTDDAVRAVITAPPSRPFALRTAARHWRSVIHSPLCRCHCRGREGETTRLKWCKLTTKRSPEVWQ